MDNTGGAGRVSPRAGPDPPKEQARSGTEDSPGVQARPPGAGRQFLWFLIKLVVIAGILAAVYVWVMGVHVQRGNRMHPYVMDGDLLITYKLGTYRVGDVVLYLNPETSQPEVSRIAAIGAYEIQITDQGELLINGSSQDEKVFYRTEKLEGSRVEYPYYMTPDGVFLLDDFRTQGKDSRLFGQITRDDLLGKVGYIFRRRGM